MAETLGCTVRMLICDQASHEHDVPEDSLCYVLLDILSVASMKTEKLAYFIFP